MRPISSDMASRLQSGATSLCTLWRVTRRDSAVFGFTDHDRPLTIDGIVYEPGVGLSPGVIEKSMGLGADTASVSGALSSAAISEDDLARGVWDGAKVDVWRADWTDPVLRAHIFAGRLGETKRGAHAFEAELRGLQTALNVQSGRVYSRYCDADVGDGRCKVALSSPAFHGSGLVASVVDARTFTASGLSGFADGWFNHGKIVWGAGGASEISVHRQAGAVATLEMLDPPAFALSVGAAFEATAGCDKRAETCRAKFANILNFRGFPHMPGNDALIAQPEAGAQNTGGSRWSS